MAYTGIRSRLPNLKFNAFIIMDTQDADQATADARDRLRKYVEKNPEAVAIVDAAEPWEVKIIPAGWGYPPRVMVTW